MTNKQYEELGKGFINLANLVGGLSIINGFFGKPNIPSEVIILLVGYIFVTLYISGLIFIKLSEER